MPAKFSPGNRVKLGSTRSGKSVSAVWDILAAVMLGWAVVCIDPHSDSLAWNTFQHLLARGYQGRILFDRLSDLDRVLGYEMLRQSTATNPLRRLAENEEQIDHAIELAGRRQGLRNLAGSPQKDENTRYGFQFLLYQRPERSLEYVPYIFEPNHPRFRELLQGCTHPDVQFRFEQIAKGNIRPSEYAATKRLFSGTFGSPVMTARCGSTFNLGDFLNNRGILLVEGGYGGVSEAVKQTIMGTIIQLTIQFIRTRRKPSPRVLLVLDEATNAQLIGEAGHEVLAMAECQKWGLDFCVLIQQDTFSKSISKQLFGNCMIHEWFFNANDDMCRQAAADLGDPSAREQMRELKPGERFVRNGRRVYREQVPMLPTPYSFKGLGEEKAKAALREIRERSEYRTPQIDPWLLSTFDSRREDDAITGMHFEDDTLPNDDPSDGGNDDDSQRPDGYEGNF